MQTIPEEKKQHFRSSSHVLLQQQQQQQQERGYHRGTVMLNHRQQQPELMGPIFRQRRQLPAGSRKNCISRYQNDTTGGPRRQLLERHRHTLQPPRMTTRTTEKAAPLPTTKQTRNPSLVGNLVLRKQMRLDVYNNPQQERGSVMMSHPAKAQPEKEGTIRTDDTSYDTATPTPTAAAAGKKKEKPFFWCCRQRW